LAYKNFVPFFWPTLYFITALLLIVLKMWQ